MVEGRKQLTFTPQEAPYSVVETVNVPPQIAVVAANHYCTLKDAKDGTYSYIDLLDTLEVISVDNENRRRDFEQHDLLRRLING